MKPGPLGERRLVVELAPGRLVERVRVGAQQARLGGVLAHVEQVLDEHAERGAPVADMVIPDHLVPGELQDPRDGVTHDGRAQVPDVHLLGDVRRGVVDDHPQRVLGQRDAESGIAELRGRRLAEPGILQRDVDEPRAAHLSALDQRCAGEVTSDRLGDLPGWPAELPGKGERDTRLVVGERRWPDHRIDLGVVRPELRGQCVAH